jgi:hypothetical protein
MCLDLKSLSGSKERWMDSFARAKQRWESIIIGNLPSIPKTSLGNLRSTICTGFPSTVDDVYICGKESKIDGPGQILGSAYLTKIRQRGSGVTNPRTGQQYWTAVTGVMEFDTADIPLLITDGVFDPVILHEMGHVLGVGTLWTDNGLYTQGSGVYASGTRADAEWNSIGCSGPLPVELDGGPGTRDGHWDEECLVNELMTGYSSVSQSPLSNITIGSMADLGYDVDYSQADTFTIGNLGVCGTSCPAKTRRLGAGERARRPRLGSVDMDKIRGYAKPKLVKLHQEATTEGNSSDSGMVPNEQIVVIYQDIEGNVYDVPVSWEDVNIV